MTKKDYVLIAEALGDVQDKISSGDLKTAQEALNCTLSNLNIALKTDNYNFDAERFVNAVLHKIYKNTAGHSRVVAR